MPEVKVLHPNGTYKSIQAEHNSSLMKALKANSIDGIEAVCDGALACATCHIYINSDWEKRVVAEDNEQSEEEIDMLELATHRRPNSRLSCQIKITNALDGLAIELP